MSLSWMDLCRICSKDGLALVDLFDGEDKPLLHLIEKYLSLKIGINDEFSVKICNECSHKVTEFHNFASECQKSQSIYERHVNKTVLRDRYHLECIKCEFEHKIIKDEEDSLFNGNLNDVSERDQYCDNDDFDDDLLPLSELKQEKNVTEHGHSLNLPIKREINDLNDNPNSSIKCEVTDDLKHFENCLQNGFGKEVQPDCVKIEPINDANNFYEPLKRRRKNRKLLDNDFSIFDFICHVCQEQCHDWKTLRLHVKQLHMTSAKVTCICFKQLSSTKSLVKHISKHDPSKCVGCTLCPRVFPSQKELDCHMTTHMPKDALPYVCCKCGKRFGTQRILQVHEKIHLSREERFVWTCSQCDAKFATKGALGNHKKVIHEKVKPYICDLCGRAFSSKTNLEDHHIRHSDAKNFACDRCPKKFKTKGALGRHIDTHGDTAYQCPHCPMLLNSRRTLRNHQFVHDEASQHPCSYCGKVFKRRKDLKGHEKLHTGEKPYSCPWCSRTFTNGSNCRIHKRRMHSTEFRLAEASNPFAPTLKDIDKDIPKKVIHTTINVRPIVLKVTASRPNDDLDTSVTQMNRLIDQDSDT